MHPRSRYKAPHDFAALAKVVPELADHFMTTPAGRLTINFTDPAAVLALNRALLLRDYGLKHWQIPTGHLTPGVPGRLDYVHALADLIGPDRQDVIGLDVGTGASLIYPILATHEYDWRMVGSEVNDQSLRVAQAIVKFNPRLRNTVIVRPQGDANVVFEGVILPGERFTFTMCNPPFFESAAAAREAADKKWQKLGVVAANRLSFGGTASELWTQGGEPRFLRRMIRQSARFADRVEWFTTLVSKKGYLKIGREELGRLAVSSSRVIDIGQGGKRRRILCWQF